MKKVIFPALITLLFFPITNTMDMPNNNNSALFELILQFVKQTSNNLQPIETFIRENQLRNTLDINYVNPLGKSPLCVAISYGCLPLVLLLVKYGANIVQELPDPTAFLSGTKSTPLKLAYERARNQKDSYDREQVIMGFQTPEYKKVFLTLFTYIYKIEDLWDEVISQGIITVPMIEYALRLAQENNQLDLAEALQDVLNNSGSSSD